MPEGGAGFERQQGLDAKIEQAGDPSALNTQEVSVVDMFAEGYNPGMPSGGGSGGHYKDEEARKKAKKKFQKALSGVTGKIQKIS